jgi:hypothetical protein
MHACLQVPEERTNIQPGIDNPSFKLKTMGSMKARPAAIPNQPITDTTKVGKGDTTTERARDEPNKVTCLFGSKCQNGTTCPYRHDSRDINFQFKLVSTKDKHVTACYCWGKNDHNRNNASSQKRNMVSHEDRSSTRRTSNGSASTILKGTSVKDVEEHIIPLLLCSCHCCRNCHAEFRV